MDDSTAELRRELFNVVSRLKKTASRPPMPPGITPAEGYAMIAIARLEASGRPVRSGEVAKFSHSTPSAMSQIFKSLEEKGFITRKRDEGDCRGVTIRLTDAGWDLEARHRRMHDRRLSESVAYLGEHDARELVRIVDKLVEFQETCPWTCEEDEAAAGVSVPAGDAPLTGGCPFASWPQDAANAPADHQGEGGAPCA